MMTIRHIQQQDATAYKHLLEQLDQETTYLAWEPGERSLSVEALKHRIATQDLKTKVTLLAEDKGIILGFLVGIRGTTRRLHHRADFTMGILKSAWNQGIGTQLLTAFEQWALNQGIWRLELTVMEHNQRAVALYEKFGFLQEGRKLAAFVVNQKKVDEIVMGKLLNTPS